MIYLRIITLALLLLLGGPPCLAVGFITLDTYAHGPGDTLTGRYTDSRPETLPVVNKIFLADRNGREVPIQVFEVARMHDQYPPNIHVLKVDFMVIIPQNFTSPDSVFQMMAVTYTPEGEARSGWLYIVPELHAEIVGDFPANGATGITLQPKFEWTSMNPGLFNQAFVEVATSSSFQKGAITLDTSVTDDFIINFPLQPNTTYYWRLRAWNGTWRRGPWSPVYSFTTGERGWLTVGTVTDSIYTIAAARGGKMVAGTAKGVYHSPDRGTSWTQIHFLRQKEILQIIANGDTLIASARGHQAGEGSQLFWSTDGGTNWLERSFTSAGQRDFWPISLTANGTIMVGTGLGDVLGYGNYGNAFGFAFNKHITDGRVTAVHGGDGMVMFAGTTTSAIGSDPGGVYRTIDSGRTWTRLSDGLPADFPVAAFVVDPVGTAYVAGSGGGVWRLTNGGTWSSRSAGLPAGSITAFTSSYDGELFVAIAGAGIYRSTDGGKSWKVTGGGTVTSAVALAVADDSLLYAATMHEVHQLRFRSEKDLAYDPVDSAMGIPLQGELRWPYWSTAERYHLQVSTTPFAAGKRDGDRELASAALVVDDSTLTSNRWEFQNLSGNTTYHWRTRALLEGGWSAWSSERLFTTEDAASAPLETVADAGLACRIFPNPSSGRSTIWFTLRDLGFVTMKVYDARGEKVAAPVGGRFEPGRHGITWDASALPAGMYYYRITAGESSDGGMVLLRD